MKIAALDLGSNTFLCLICNVVDGKITTIFYDEVQVVRLGQGLSLNKKFHPEALIRAQKTLRKFSEVIQQHRPDKVLAMATSAARDAENKDELFEICKSLNIPLEIISGHNEAFITYQGAISGQSQNERRVVIDIGGGSTEYIFGDNVTIHKSHSFDIGCVRLTEKFIHNQPTPVDQLENCRNYIQKCLQSVHIADANEVETLLAVAGTPTALVTAEIGIFDPAKIDGYSLTLDKLQDWENKLKKASVQEKVRMGIPEGRADVILVGVIILIETLKLYNKKQLTVSTRGVRYGVALHAAEQKN